jgi:hypothetical protein
MIDKRKDIPDLKYWLRCINSKIRLDYQYPDDVNLMKTN